jgi:SWI/SNF-related matrix-associated actin-dependent regulator 1 of chromatin subfamily A
MSATTALSAPPSYLRAYQLDGVNWLVRAQHRAPLLADDPGLGKSLQVLETLDVWHARRVLVIAPAIGRLSWREQVRRWAKARLPHLQVVEGQAKPDGAAIRHADDLFLVLSYDLLSQPLSRERWIPVLCSRGWDVLVLDEAHFLKNPDSARTRAVYGHRHPGDGSGLEQACKRVILLTGTPTPNNAGELWPHYRTFWWRDQGDLRPIEHHEWQEQFCNYVDGVWGRQVTGSKNQPALRTRLKGTILRRTKREVLTELPPVQTQDVALDVPSRLTAAVNGAVDRNTPVGPDVSEVSLSRARRLLGEAKAPLAAQWAMERLESGDKKILLFCWHRSVISRLVDLLAEFEPVSVVGQTSPAERQAAVSLFTHRPQCRVFVGQVLAAGTAITLTSAAHVGIVEPSWVPGENDQAISRAHRLGQRERVLASFLYMPDTLDETIMRVFRRKADQTLCLYDATKPENA